MGGDYQRARTGAQDKCSKDEALICDSIYGAPGPCGVQVNILSIKPNVTKCANCPPSCGHLSLQPIKSSGLWWAAWSTGARLCSNVSSPELGLRTSPARPSPSPLPLAYPTRHQVPEVAPYTLNLTVSQHLHRNHRGLGHSHL